MIALAYNFDPMENPKIPDDSSTSEPMPQSFEYSKGFKFVLPKPFKGDQQEVEPWLFNLEQYFDNTGLSVEK